MGAAVDLGIPTYWINRWLLSTTAKALNEADLEFSSIYLLLGFHP
jgi:hypothetical protein